MNPAQQQIMAAWQQGFERAGAEFQALLQETANGCQSLVAQHPTDMEPLVRALRAVEVQRRMIQQKCIDSEIMWKLQDADPKADLSQVLAQVKRADREFARWADEQWARFECQWVTTQLGAMWPHVQEELGRAVPCERCGSPMTRTKPRQSESITCPACGAVNQVAPHPMVDAYFSASYFFDEPAAIDARFALQKFEDEWEDRRDAEFAAGRQRPEPSLEYLEQLERLQRTKWTLFFQSRVKNQGGSAEDVARYVEERMQLVFYPSMNKNPVWTSAHPAPPAPTAPDPTNLLEPIEGVTAQQYGELEAKHQKLDPASFVQHLAAHQMDEAKFERVARAWCDRMAHDAKNLIYAEYSKGLLSQAATADSVSFEKFCEIQGAWNAWSKQGKDPSASLSAHFSLTPTDFSGIAMGWMQKMTATPTMFDDFSRLTAEAERKYLALP